MVFWYVLNGKEGVCSGPQSSGDSSCVPRWGPRDGLVVAWSRGYPLENHTLWLGGLIPHPSGHGDPHCTHQSAKAGPCQKKSYHLVQQKRKRRKGHGWREKALEIVIWERLRSLVVGQSGESPQAARRLRRRRSRRGGGGAIVRALCYSARQPRLTTLSHFGQSLGFSIIGF